MSQILLLSNPRKRRKAKRSKAKRKSYRRKSARRTTARRRRRTSVRVYRRNPVGRIGGMIVPTITNGFMGAVGGIGNDLLYGYGKRFLPAMLQSGIGRHATKLLTAVVVGIAGNYVLKGRGSQLASGAATVVLHEAIKEQLASFAPALPLGAMDEAPGLLGYEPGYPVDGFVPEGVGAYMEPGLGAYMEGAEEGIGDGGDGY